MVDGITVTDPYNAGMAVEIENNAIQELQFISGTFNAEYGQAMSGIVNIVTKDGDYSKYSGSLSGSFGDYYISPNRVSFSNASYPLFPQVDNLNLDNVNDLKANFEGPVIPGVLSFFVSGRKQKNNGYLFGEHIFHPNSYLWSDTQNMFRIDSAVGLGNGDRLLQDSLWSPGNYQDSLFVYIDSLRENDMFDWVSMNTNDQLTYQAKLSWRVTPKLLKLVIIECIVTPNRKIIYMHIGGIQKVDPFILQHVREIFLEQTYLLINLHSQIL